MRIIIILLWACGVFGSHWAEHATMVQNGDVGESHCSLMAGGVDKAACSNAGTSVGILYTTYTPAGVTAWTITATLVSPSCGGCSYGERVSLVGDTVTGNMLYVSAIDSVSENGEVYFYRGSWSQWSSYQILTPLHEGNDFSDDPNRFGGQMDADPVHGRLLAVACEACLITNNTNHASGAVFMYDTESVTAKKMTQTQVLTSAQASLNRIGESFVSIYDSVLVSSVVTNNLNRDALLYTRNSTTRAWSQQQILNGAYDVVAADVYNNTIVFGAPSAVVSAQSGAGEVYVLYPYVNPANNRTVWSQAQVLRDGSPTVNEAFGSDVAVDRNSMFITAADKSIYVYERETYLGQWSLHQVIAASPNGHDIAADDGVLLAYSAVTGAATSYSGDMDWNCIIVELMDQFGDGWDKAELHIHAPDGTFQRFAPYCQETPSPLSFRYCPPSLEDDDAGLYKLHIHNAPKSKFNWEILWRVFREETGGGGDWFTGDLRTTMDFFFDVPEESLQERKMEHLRKNATCSQCATEPPPKPKPKPKSSSSRNLKKSKRGSGTSGTVPDEETTASPTLAFAPVSEFEYLTLQTVGTEWFREDYQGTEYYISDPGGKHLILRGTLCAGSLEQVCWVGLPDGDYVLRVGGNLLGDSGDHSWEFCGRNGAASDELLFRIYNRTCDPLTHYSASSVCTSQDALITGLGTVALTGAQFRSIELLTSDDRAAFAAGIVGALPGTKESSVEIVDIDHLDGLVYVQFVASFDKNVMYSALRAALGDEGENYLHGDSGAYTSLQDTIESSLFSDGFLVGKYTGDNSIFMHTTEATLVEFIVTESEVLASPTPSPDLSITVDTLIEAKHHNIRWIIGAGVVCVIAGLILVVNHVKRKVRRVKQFAADAHIPLDRVGVFVCIDNCESVDYRHVNADEDKQQEYDA